MFFQNKKGSGGIFWEIVIKLSLTIFAVMVISFGMSGFFASDAQAATLETTCRASVVLRNVINAPVVGASPSPLICKQQNMIEEFGKIKDTEMIKKRIAELSARCWWEFGNGAYRNVLSQDLVKTNNYCFTCYYFTISGKESISANDIYQYMESAIYKPGVDVSEKDKNKGDEKIIKDVTYLDYIQYGGGYAGIPENLIMEPKKEVYAIVYVEPHSTLKVDFWGMKSVNPEQLINRNLIHINRLSDVPTKLNCVMLTDIQGR